MAAFLLSIELAEYTNASKSPYRVVVFLSFSSLCVSRPAALGIYMD